MSTPTTTLTDKQLAQDALARMSEAATLAEISERFAILAGLQRGQQDVDEGRVVTHEEAKRRSSTWIGK